MWYHAGKLRNLRVVNTPILMNRTTATRWSNLGALSSAVAIIAVLLLVSVVHAATPRACAGVSSCPIIYPTGTPSATAVSHMAPPPARFPGYRLIETTTFPGSSVPAGWYAFSGQPGGDPGTSFSPRHVVVANNVVSLNAFPVATSHGIWMTGGLCECDRPFRYGAVFVRSRMTGAGATQVEMLWPKVGTSPEVDFDETFGGIYQSTATVHYGAEDFQIHRVKAVNMLLWHTWGVIWTPTTLIYTLDGHAWGSVTTPAAIPHVAMSVHLQQQTWCSARFACPTAPVSTQVAWVARYANV